MKKLFAVFAALLLLCNVAWAAVNLNTATPQQLEALKGIGPAKAKAIVDYRTKNGPFKTVDDLKKVSGIGDKTLESLRKEVTVGGAAVPAAKPAAAKPAAAKPAAK
ncbi:DNA uptake protein ComE or related DNA-binding protein [Chromobacterium violaceum]|uniref:ComE operon protein 1 n=2 Tax=Chromobacterium violaceum TaxID=536 RepID=A0A202BBH4_CHRVL|nr:helix-hairpin-helix domain-containing protein [Chromobacterium violaceum]AAQ61493.1 probable DNA transport competence protein [Chromobacterium violaceum ATCC 12472]ATP30094.1 topoisomerase [Chromobacterium violaceum]ATP34000.1 topoisomerase [Chromobacterium violaceum]KJH66090.1 topoisomerase [Chromobacterium violaceum]KMN50316.1 topoisomerase [Chromobacterium violaceum]